MVSIIILQTCVGEYGGDTLNEILVENIGKCMRLQGREDEGKRLEDQGRQMKKLGLCSEHQGSADDPLPLATEDATAIDSGSAGGGRGGGGGPSGGSSISISSSRTYSISFRLPVTDVVDLQVGGEREINRKGTKTTTFKHVFLWVGAAVGAL